MVPDQNGHICKPAALAALDAYFSQKYAVRNIPLRKSLASGGESSSPDRLMSVRKIAKANGSVQGEILQADMFERVAQQMGYEARRYHPTSIDDFKKTVVDHISNGTPLVTFFALGNRLRPSSEFNGYNEHAALIVGYAQKGDAVTLAHYQTLVKSVQTKKLYESMQKLPSKREQEIYKNTGKTLSGSSGQYKHVLVQFAGSSDADFRYSIVPKAYSGFKNTLFIVSPDPANDRWSRTGTWSIGAPRG